MQAGKKSKWNATGALKNDNYLFIQVENFLKSFMSPLLWHQNVLTAHIFSKCTFYDYEISHRKFTLTPNLIECSLKKLKLKQKLDTKVKPKIWIS